MPHRDVVHPSSPPHAPLGGVGGVPPWPASEADRFRFLGVLGQALATADTLAAVLASLRGCLLPALGDWWLIQLTDDQGAVRDVQVAHADPDRVGLARLAADYRPAGVPGGAWAAWRTDTAVLTAESDGEPAAALACNEEHRTLIRGLGLRSYVTLPLHGRGRLLGGMTVVCGDSLRRYGPGDLPFLTAVADRIALTIDSAALQERLEAAEALSQRRARSFELLAKATEVFAAASLHVDDTLAQVTRLLCESFADAGVIRLVDDAGAALQHVAVWHRRPDQLPYVDALAQTPLKMDEGFGGQVFRSGEPFAMHGLSPADLLHRVPARFRKPLSALQPVGVLVVPLRVGERIIGVLNLLRTVGSAPFSDDDLVLARDLADRAGRAIAHARLYEAADLARQRAEAASQRMARLQHVTAALSQARTPQEVAAVIVRAGSDALQATCSVVYEVLPDRRHLRLIDRVGGGDGWQPPWETMAIGRSCPACDVVRTGQPLFVDTTQAFRRRYPGLGDGAPLPGGARAVMPLIVDGDAIGAMGFAFDGDRPFSEEDRTFLRALADQCAHALERARLYERLSQGEQEVRTLINALPAMVAFVDRDHRYRQVNQAYLRFLYPSQGQVRGLHVRDVVGESFYQRILPILDRVMAGERMHSEVAYARGQQSPRWLMADHVPLVGANGEVTGFVSLIQDMTERKAMDDRLAQALEHERRARLEADQVRRQVSVVASFSDALYASLDVGEIIQAIVRMAIPEVGDLCFFDLLNSESRLERVAWASADPAEDLQGISRLVPALTDAHSPIIRALSSKEPVICLNPDDSSLRAFATSAEHLAFLQRLGLCSFLCIPVLHGDAVLGVLTCSLRDRSGRQHDDTHLLLGQALAWRAANALHQARLYQEAQSALQVRDDFLSLASHELRTPLTSLGLQLEIIRRQVDRQGSDPVAAALRPRLAKLGADLDRLSLLVGEISDVTRLASGRLQMAFRQVALADLLDELVGRFAPQVEASGSTVSIDVPVPISGCWDPFRLDQVLANLLSNAITYGEGRPITIQATSSDGWAEIVVRDRGIGIARADQGRLFKRFERFAPAIHKGGFGLGLWMARRLIEAMGGTISLASDSGQGAAFAVRLPLERDGH